MNINVFLIRLMQFITFALFIFAALVYAGVFLLVPLDILFQGTRVLHGMGFPVVLAFLGAGAALGWLGKKVWEMPALWQLVLDIGMQLVAHGREQIKRYDDVLASYQTSSPQSK
ncbi:hypothetical protein [Methylogaea oryzae]|uniref:Uncharacterized protein n=1 Tax=Methylogaea oryzae TaxID=1295382 RepID=A0A8D4VMQ4_9GAMM|nr:hypothetical protein [Methylogaea oryzae]BBL70685.1 hypothetical protein MoryE10_12910 [Methylogaea oryzae]